MRKLKLLLNFISDGSIWGLVWGSILGTIWYLIVFQFSVSIYILYFTVFGAIAGTLLGSVNGFVLSLTTFNPNLSKSKHYTFVLLIVATVTTSLTSFALFNFVLSYYEVAPNTQNRVLLALLGAVLAMLASGFLSQSLAKWYLKNSDQLNLDA